MPRKISPFTSSSSPNRFRFAAIDAGPTTSRLLPQVVGSGGGAAGRQALPAGLLWDPTLLGRLHAPLTRYRD